MSPTPPARIDGRLIVGGMAHDFDYARLEILSAMAAHPQVRMSVSDSFEDIAALSAASFLVTYTCNLKPSAAAAQALREFVARGGRWFALHATNSILAWTQDGVAAMPDETGFIDLLGSQFVAHPPIGPYRVEVVAPDHPLCRGIDDFDTVDELYLSDITADLTVLMHTRFVGDAPGFIRRAWPDDAARPVLYARRFERGEILYCTLGHCRGHWDSPHRTPYYPVVERCSWQTPAFRKILARGLAWAAHLDEETGHGG